MQVFQVCDRLAEAGLSVAAADTFRGQPWSKEKFPPKPEDNFMGWIQSEGSYDKVSKDVMKVGVPQHQQYRFEAEAEAVHCLVSTCSTGWPTT